MATVIVDKIINSSISKVWLSWDKFGDVDAFNPNLKRSFLLEGSAATGLGATRQCDFVDGKNYIREKVIAYAPEKSMKVDIYDGTVPLRTATAQIDLTALGPQKTKVTFTIIFTPKFGLFGALLIPIMKPQFRKDIGALLTKNAAFVESQS